MTFTVFERKVPPLNLMEYDPAGVPEGTLIVYAEDPVSETVTVPEKEFDPLVAV
jgi:hypothetical protein